MPLNLFCEKGLGITKIRFSGLNGTNSMFGEVCGLQAFIRKAAVFSFYINVGADLPSLRVLP